MSRTIKILSALAVAVFCIQIFSGNKADVDLWGNVGFVKGLPWSQEFKYLNTFSFTEPQHPWINHEWLAQYILNIAYSNFGNPGLLTLKIALGLLAVIMIYTAMREFCGSRTVMFLWLLLVTSTMGYGFSTRPHLFTYALYSFFLLALHKYRFSETKYLKLLPIFGLIWANLHGAFFIGLLLLGLYSVLEMARMRASAGIRRPWRGVRALVIITALFIAATLINPYGLRLWGFLLQSALKSRPYLSEWSALTRVAQLGEHPDFVILSLFSFLGICFSSRPKDMTWLGVLTASFICALIMRRNIPLFAITAGFVVFPYIEDVAGKQLGKIFNRNLRPLLVLMLSVFILMSASYAMFFHKTDPLEIEVQQDRFPVSAVSFMSLNGISGNALAFFDWAEYCIWKVYPRCRVFLDGRFRSAYSSCTIDDYFNFLYLGKNWENALNNYPVDIVLIHKGNPVYQNMLSQPEWIKVYDDEISGLFLKISKHAEFLVKLNENKILYPQPKKYEYFP